MSATLPKIIELHVLSPPRMHVRWDTGQQWDIDFGEVIGRGGVFSRLANSSVFSSIRVSDDRRSIEWPDPFVSGEVMADYCSDALLLLGERQEWISRTEKQLPSGDDFKGTLKRLA